MTDVHNPAIRSKNMRAIKSKHTWPERYVRKILHHSGFRFRLHPTHLPARPDIFLPKYQAVILVNSCFWHGHPCHLFHWPKSDPEHWRQKILDTQQRDRRNLAELRELNIRVLLIWECALKGRRRLSENALAERLEEWLIAVDFSCEISWQGLHELEGDELIIQERL